MGSALMIMMIIIIIIIMIIIIIIIIIMIAIRIMILIILVMIIIIIMIIIMILLTISDIRKGTNGVSTSGVTANVMFFDRGTFWALLLAYFCLPKKSARA